MADYLVEMFLGGQWVDITGDVRETEPITIVRGRRDEGTRVDPAQCTLKLNNRHGKYSRKNAVGPYYDMLGRNTPLRVSVTTPTGTVSRRATVEIAELPTRWDLSGNNIWVQLKASGLLRRLGTGAPPLHDAIRRHIERHRPLAYWPLTDGQTARHGSEVASGAQPLRPIGLDGSFYQGQPDWGRGQLAPWLEPVVELPVGTGGILAARVPLHSVTGWAFDRVFGGSGEAGVNDAAVYDTGAGSDADPQVVWLVEASPVLDLLSLTVEERGETISSSVRLAEISNPGVFNQSAHHVRLATHGDEFNSNWALLVDGVEVASGIYSTAHRPASRIAQAWGLNTGGVLTVEPLALGHITYWGENAPDAESTMRALLGYDRELAGRRIERLCAEQQVALQATGNLDDTPEMGPQRAGAFLDVLRAAEAVDGGVLGEARDELALAYRTRTSRYNQGV